MLVAVAALPVRAEENAAKPSPRTAVEIGGASVVLVAANDKIYAFIDRLEDNAPVADAALSVDLADGSSLKLTRVSDGLFVAPFNRAGHMQDAFMVSLVSPDGTGDGAAEIGYDDVPAPEVRSVRFDLRANATVAAGGRRDRGGAGHLGDAADPHPAAPGGERVGRFGGGGLRPPHGTIAGRPG